MVGQPGVGGERQPAGEQRPVAAAERERRAQQRVLGGVEPERLGVRSPPAPPPASSARAGTRRSGSATRSPRPRRAAASSRRRRRRRAPRPARAAKRSSPPSSRRSVPRPRPTADRRPRPPSVVGHGRGQHRVRADLDEGARRRPGPGRAPPARSAPAGAGCGTSTRRRRSVAVERSPVTVEYNGMSLAARRDRRERRQQLARARPRRAASGRRSRRRSAARARRRPRSAASQRVERLGVAGDDERGGAVDRGDGDPPVPGGARSAKLVGRQRDRDHAAAARDLRQAAGCAARRSARRPRATARRRRGRRRSRPASGRRPRRARRRRRARARPGRPSPRRGPAGRRRCGRARLRRARRAATSSRRPVDVGRQRRVAAPRMRSAKTRRRVEQLDGHARPLASPGRGRRSRRGPSRRATPRDDAVGRARRARARARPPSSSSRSGADDHRAVLEAARGRGQRAGDVGRVELGVRARRTRRSRPACAAQRGSRLAETTRNGSTAAAGASSAPARASPAAGASSRITWALVPLMPKEETPARRGRPLALPRHRPRSAARPRPPPSRRAGRARRRAASSAGRPSRIAMHHLDHAGDAGRGLGVADVGLDRAEPQRPVCALLAVGGEQGAWPRSGRRGWCRCRGPRPRRRRRASRPALASAWRITRSCEGPLGAVRPLEAPSWLTAEPRITASTAVAVALARRRGARGRACRRPRTKPAPSARLGEGLAAPVGGEAALAAELDEERRASRAPSTPPASASVALARAQRLRGQVQRDQRGGAGGVDGDRRALEAERVGDAAGDDARRAAGQPGSPRARRGGVAADAVVRGA